MVGHVGERSERYGDEHNRQHGDGAPSPMLLALARKERQPEENDQGAVFNLQTQQLDYLGQNGFYTAALFASGLTLVERRPIAAGILLGLLCCKPQLGLQRIFAGGKFRRPDFG